MLNCLLHVEKELAMTCIVINDDWLLVAWCDVDHTLGLWFSFPHCGMNWCQLCWRNYFPTRLWAQLVRSPLYSCFVNKVLLSLAKFPFISWCVTGCYFARFCHQYSKFPTTIWKLCTDSIIIIIGAFSFLSGVGFPRYIFHFILTWSYVVYHSSLTCYSFPPLLVPCTCTV